VAGALDAREAMRLVVERGKLMSAMTEGTMAAVLGLQASDVEAICADVAGDAHAVVVVANDNAPGQVVISGSPEAVETAGRIAKERGAKRVVPLQVSGAFHSPLMQPAADTFAAVLNAAAWSDPVIPVVTNVDARPTSTAGELRACMIEQLRSPVRWRATLQTLTDLGVATFIEAGPGNVLTGLARRAFPDVVAIAVNNVEGVAAATAEVMAARG
jgi:[acyl-carrier-protein] S-malonyltransferase